MSYKDMRMGSTSMMKSMCKGCCSGETRRELRRGFALVLFLKAEMSQNKLCPRNLGIVKNLVDAFLQ